MLNQVITMCIDSNTHLLYIYIIYINSVNTAMYKSMGYSDMFRLTEWLRAFGIPDGLQYVS
jgi:hypothetical protein